LTRSADPELALSAVLLFSAAAGGFRLQEATSLPADHPKVINGCLDLFYRSIQRSRAARSCAVGMASLPFNISVQIEAVTEAG